MPDKIYLYDGSFEGLLTCVFEAYYRHEDPTYIEPSYASPMRFDCEYSDIPTDTEKSDRVFASLEKKLSKNSLYNIYYAYLSDLAGKEKSILDYIRLGLRVGYSLDSRLTEECVRAVCDISKRVGSEAHKYKGLLRFSELSGGAMYGEIEPKNNILPIIAPHFARRLSGIPWIIFDTSRRLCCVYDTSQWYLRGADSVHTEFSQEEEKYRAMWRAFYDTIEIKERHNEKCRMTCMPKRYWNKLTEMQSAGGMTL